MIAYFSKCREKLPMILGALAIVAMLVVGLIGMNFTAYAVHIDEEVKLLVKSIDSVEKATEDIEAILWNPGIGT